MDTPREEIREQLMAAIEAAPELAPEARQHLADVFLDELNARYDLVPRGTGKRAQSARPIGRPPWSGRWLPVALVLAFLVVVVPATFHHHFPVFLLFVLGAFLVMRRIGWGLMRGRPSWR
jgi:hypothetical protein